MSLSFRLSFDEPLMVIAPVFRTRLPLAVNESVGFEPLALPSVKDFTLVTALARLTVNVPAVWISTSSTAVGSVLLLQLLASLQFTASPPPSQMPFGVTGTGSQPTTSSATNSTPRFG